MSEHVAHELHKINETLQSLSEGLVQLMAALNTDALTQAVSDNTTAVQAAVAVIAAGGSTDNTAAQAAVDSATAQIETNTSALNAADAAPAPAPAPAPAAVPDAPVDAPVDAPAPVQAPPAPSA
jgi:hypothetical protein